MRTTTPSGALPDLTGVPDRPARLTDADVVVAAGGRLLRALDTEPLDLPPLAEVGAPGLDRAVRAAVAGVPGALVVGTVPFDPSEPPALRVATDPRWLPLPAPVASGQHPGHPRAQASLAALAGRGVAPAEHPAHGHDEAYLEAVSTALACIETGALDKVVLARSEEIPGTFDVETVWTRLLAHNEAGWTYAVREAEAVLVGASPELVASVHGGVLRTHPLAGSLPLPASGVEQARERLLCSAKDLHEHQLVVDHLVRRLAPLVRSLDVPATPRVCATDTMLHLGSPMTGRVRDGVGSLEAALAVHPTPAVCGVPGAAALEAVRALEARPRGSYAGLVGWCTADGDGEWALALRCAHLHAGGARLHAGAGVVRGSSPEGELAETVAKMRTVARALGLSEQTTIPTQVRPQEDA